VRLGVFDEALEPDQVIARAELVAGELAAMPREVYARTKRELRGGTFEAMRTAAAADPLLNS